MVFRDVAGIAYHEDDDEQGLDGRHEPWDANCSLTRQPDSQTDVEAYEDDARDHRRPTGLAEASDRLPAALCERGLDLRGHTDDGRTIARGVSHPGWVMGVRVGRFIIGVMRSSQNRLWGLLALAVWVAIFCAFLLIAIPHH